MTSRRLPYVWDYDIDEDRFREMLAGRYSISSLDRDWACVRLLGFKDLLAGWPRWRGRIRSVSRKRGFDFLAEWLPRRHPELLR